MYYNMVQLLRTDLIVCRGPHVREHSLSSEFYCNKIGSLQPLALFTVLLEEIFRSPSFLSVKMHGCITREFLRMGEGRRKGNIE